MLLVPLTFALFTPLGVPGFAWWAAALNSLPMLAAMAWVCADAILLVRTGNQRYAVTALLVYLRRPAVLREGRRDPVRRVRDHRAARPRHRRRLRAPNGLAGRHAVVDGSLALTAAWIVLYLVVVDQERWSSRSADDMGSVEPLHHSRHRAGTRRRPVGLAALGARLAVGDSPGHGHGARLARARRRDGGLTRPQAAHRPAVVVAAGYAIACQMPIYLMRSSRFTALELAQTLRYFPDLVVVLALLAAVGFCAPNRNDLAGSTLPARTAVTSRARSGVRRRAACTRPRRSLTIWQDNPAQPYLQNARSSLAAGAHDVDAPLLDQEVDPLVLQRVAWPENLASHMFALLHNRPEFASQHKQLRMLDNHGRLVDAKVTWVRTIVPGPDAAMRLPRAARLPVRMPLDGPLLPSDWTAEINYLANSDGSMTMSLSRGTRTKVPVHPGLNRVFVRLPGAGNAISVRANTAALCVCIAAGPVGYCCRADAGPGKRSSHLGESNS